MEQCSYFKCVFCGSTGISATAKASTTGKTRDYVCHACAKLYSPEEISSLRYRIKKGYAYEHPNLPSRV